MSNLDDFQWRAFYSPDNSDRVKDFYIPALSCAIRYDRSTGYFTAPALALAMRGLEGLIINGGKMRVNGGEKMYQRGGVKMYQSPGLSLSL